MTSTLRDYQIQAINDVEAGIAAGHVRQILCLPTGSGKTITAGAMIQRQRAQGRRALFIVERLALVDQAVRAFSALGLHVGIYQGENTQRSVYDDVVVASAQTIAARKRAPLADFIVIDEAHILHKVHIELMRAWGAVPVVGLTATPLRPDLGKYFSRLVRGPSVQELTDWGFLVPARAYCPSAAQMDRILSSVRTQAGDFQAKDLAKAINRKELVGDIVGTWQAKAADRLTLAFAVDIAHSKAIVDDFQAAGVPAAHVCAYTPEAERNELFALFRSGELRVLSSVAVLGIGFDVPDAACAILARPTLSEALHMQQAGRVLRPAPGKQDALLLDHAGNTLRFGLPQHFRVPELGDIDHAKTQAKRKQRRMVVCSKCGFALEPDQRTCPSCGVDRCTRTSSIVYLDGVLQEYGGQPGATDSLVDRQEWYRAFLWRASYMNRKVGWAYHAFLAKFDGAKPPYSWQRLEPKIPTEEQMRWIKYYEIRQAKQWQRSGRIPEATP